MSTTGQSETAQSSQKRGLSACPPLIDAATKDLFRKNAFRITGLPVDATAREEAKHNDIIKQLAEFGKDPHTQDAAFPIKPAPGLDEIREAIQKLKDPEKRFIDEFFWFWPEEHGQSKSDPAIQALVKGDSNAAIEIWSAKEKSAPDGSVAAHNLALVYHILALDWEYYSFKNEVDAERRQKITKYWKGAFKLWERLAGDERFWEKVTTRIRQLDEPNLQTGFARRMRASLPEALNKINAELAVAFAESGKIETARIHLQMMRETRQGNENVEKVAELVLTPARNRIKEQIQRAKQSAQENPTAANEAARILIEYAHPLLEVFDLFFGEQEHFQKELFDEVATTAVNCLVAYQRKTGDNETFVKLLERSLPLAESIEVRRRIEENIGIGKGNLRGKELDSVYALLKSIQDSKESPVARLTRFKRDVVTAITKVAGISGFSLNYGYLSTATEEYKELFESAAIVLRGISLDAWNNHQDRQTAVEANKLAIMHAISAELKQRLAEDKSTLGGIPSERKAAFPRRGNASSPMGLFTNRIFSIFAEWREARRRHSVGIASRVGDSGGENDRMERGSYDGGIYVLFAFLGEIVCVGILSVSFITNILKIPCDDTTSWIVGGLAGLGIALLTFWDRWKCIEAFSSRFCCGFANFSIIYVPVVAFAYANWRGIKKICDSNEWEDSGTNKSTRIALAASAVMLILGIVGECKNDGASNSTAYTPPVRNSPPPSTVYTPPASSAPAYTPPPASESGNSGGNVYRVPNDVSSALDREKEGIEADRAVLKQLDDQLDSLGREIDSDRIYLDKTSQYAVDAFNAKVDRYNTLSQQDKAATAAFNERVDNYNAKLRQYGH